MGNRSTEKLVAALRGVGAPADLIAMALAESFHDFQSASATPINDLVRECERHGLVGIATRAKNGDFDADRAEADEWLKSPDGQQTLKDFGSRP